MPARRRVASWGISYFSSTILMDLLYPGVTRRAMCLQAGVLPGGQRLRRRALTVGCLSMLSSAC